MHEGLSEVSTISPSIHLAEVPPKLVWPGKQLNFNGVLCETGSFGSNVTSFDRLSILQSAKEM